MQRPRPSPIQKKIILTIAIIIAICSIIFPHAYAGAEPHLAALMTLSLNISVELIVMIVTKYFGEDS